MSGRRYTHIPSDADPSHYRSQTPDVLDRAAVARRSTLIVVLRHARANVIGAVGFVELVEMLGLDEELLELAGELDVEPERHRRIEAAQLQLGLSVDELEDRTVDRT